MKSKKNHIKKKYTLGGILSIIGGMAIGFVATATNFRFFNVISDEYTSLPLWGNILVIIIMYFFSVAVHELTHFITFIKNGVKMRALIIGFLCFLYDGEKWRLKLKYNNVTSIGGIAIPNLGVIKDEEEIKKLQQGFARAIISAPIASIILGITYPIIFIPIMHSVQSVILKSIIYTSVVTVIIAAIIITLSSFAKSELAYGDFPAYKESKNNRFFILVQLYQYAIFSTKHDEVRRNNTYLKEVIVEELERKYMDKATDIFTLGVIDTLIVEYLVGIIDSIPKVVQDYVEYFTENYDILTSKKSIENCKILGFHIVYLLESQGEREKALSLYDKLRENAPESHVMEYYKKQTATLLRLEDHREFLRDKSNIKTSSAFSLWNIFEGYYVDDMKLNSRID